MFHRPINGFQDYPGKCSKASCRPLLGLRPELLMLPCWLQLLQLLHFLAVHILLLARWCQGLCLTHAGCLCNSRDAAGETVAAASPVQLSTVTGGSAFAECSASTVVSEHLAGCMLEGMFDDWTPGGPAVWPLARPAAASCRRAAAWPA